MEILLGVFDEIVVRYGEGLMVILSDGKNLGTVNRIIGEDDGIKLGKTLGVKLVLSLVWSLVLRLD